MSEAEKIRPPLRELRAGSAYKAIKAVKDATSGMEPTRQQAFTTVAQNLPLMIRQNGIGQALAFLMSKAEGKKESPEGRVIQILTEWLVSERKLISRVDAVPVTEVLIRSLMQSDRGSWARAQREAIEYSAWLKRFAEALLPKKEKQPAKDEEAQL